MNIPTAQQHIIEMLDDLIYVNKLTQMEKEEIAVSHIKFAQVHVKAALETANRNCQHTGEKLGEDFPDVWTKSILNAYHLSNIK